MKSPEVQLKEISIKITKGTTPTTMGFDFKDEGINFIKAESITRSGIIDESTFAFIDMKTHESLKRSQIQKRDILLTIAGIYLGKVGIAKAHHIPANTNQAVSIIRLNKTKALPEYIKYFLFEKSTTTYLNQLCPQSAQPNLNLTQLGKLKFNLPPLDIQKKIAAILTAYDDLIEANKRRIALLEKMAEELYREWFVRMRFPGHQNIKFVKGVPEGWEPIKIGERVSTQYGFTESANDNPSDPKFLRITDIVPRQIDWDRVPYCPIGESDEEKYLLHEGDILVARTGATVGYAKRINKINWRAVFASYLVRLVPKNPVDSIYFGMAVESKAFKDFIQGFVTGAAQPQANATTMSLFTLYYPGVSLLKRFNKVIQPILDQRDLLVLQARALTRTRDLLLPRLISGKLSVEDLDIRFPPSGYLGSE